MTDIDDRKRFDRLAMVVGDYAVSALNDARVLVIGLGGVGGSCAEALLRSGIRKLTIVDGDEVDPTNLNRQIIATEDTIGIPKTEAMEKRLLAIDSKAEIEKIDKFLLAQEDWPIDMADYDFVSDAIDTVSTKIEIARKCHKSNTALISAMGFGNKLDPTRVEITMASKTRVCPLARAYRKMLREEGIGDVAVVFSEEIPAVNSRPPGSTSFVPTVAGLCMAGYIVREIVKDQ